MKAKSTNWTGVSVVRVGKPAEGSLSIDSAAARRIVGATVRKSGEGLDFDFQALAEEISQVADAAEKLNALRWSKLGKVKSRNSKISAEIGSCAMRLHALLDNEAPATIRRKLKSTIEDRCRSDNGGASWPQFIACLDAVALTTKAESGEDADIQPFLIDTTLAQYMAGKGLPPIYKKHFRVRAGISRAPTIRDDGTDTTLPPSGPFVRFVTATFHELNIRKKDGNPYGPETIAGALAVARRGQRRS